MNEHTQTPVRPWLLFAFFLVALAAGGWRLYQSDLVYWNVGYLLKAKTALEIDLTQFRGNQSMAQFKEQYSQLDWYCKRDTHGISDTICVDDHIKSWNGNPAMSASFYFTNDALTHIAVHVPKWRHDEVKQYLFSHLGRPHARDQRGENKADIVVWNLKSGGGMVFNVDPEPVPLQWSMVFWYSPDAVKRRDGLIRPGAPVQSNIDSETYGRGLSGPGKGAATRAGVLPEDVRTELVRKSLQHFWGKATLSNGELVQPSSDVERKTVPVSPSIASRVLDIGEVSGLADWCRLDWEANYFSLTKAARNRGLSEKQVAFISVLHGATQGMVSSAMSKSQTCGESQRANIQQMLNQSLGRGLNGA